MGTSKDSGDLAHAVSPSHQREAGSSAASAPGAPDAEPPLPVRSLTHHKKRRASAAKPIRMPKPQRKTSVLVHADDFGITVEQSQRILSYSTACGGQGALNSVSVFANGPAFADCAYLLDEHWDHLHVALHVNVVEGPSVLGARTVPLLVDENDVFCLSFQQMLSLSMGSRHDELQAQLEMEIGAQLDRYLERFPKARHALRIDSHQHFHLIPAVFDAMLAVIDSRECELEYIRIPAEPVTPFLQNPAVLPKIPPINWIKHWLLNYLWHWDNDELEGHQDLTGVFCGINLSGHMTPDRVSHVLKSFEAYAKAKGQPLELLFHPGGCPKEDCMNPALGGFVDFYTSPNRAREGETIRKLEEWLA